MFKFGRKVLTLFDFIFTRSKVSGSAINVMPLLALHFGNARQVARLSALHLQDYQVSTIFLNTPINLLNSKRIYFSNTL